MRATGDITGVEVVRRAAPAATPSDLLVADAVVLGTPANMGYMSGALKHFFDTVSHICADDTRGLPLRSPTAPSGPWSRSRAGWAGAVGAPVVEVRGAPGAAAREACSELGSALAAAITTDAG